MNMFTLTQRTHSDNSTFWLFLTRALGIQVTAVIVVVFATLIAVFALYVNDVCGTFPKMRDRILACVIVEVLTVALALAGYWMILYAYGII